MDLTQIIYLGGFSAQLILTFMVYKWQSAQIAAQKGTIDAMKSNLDGAKTFMDLFNIDKVKAYVEMSNKTKDMEVKEAISFVEKQLAESEKTNESLRDQLENYKNLEKKNRNAKVHVDKEPFLIFWDAIQNATKNDKLDKEIGLKIIDEKKKNK